MQGPERWRLPKPCFCPAESKHCLSLGFPSMATLYHMQQVLTGQFGKYKIVKQLQKAVWLARYQPIYLFDYKVDTHPSQKPY